MACTTSTQTAGSLPLSDSESCVRDTNLLGLIGGRVFGGLVRLAS
jgi:hypothetical protein